MLISIQHLSKSIGAKDLFTDLELYISPGEKVALVGRNGQGKTTLLNIIGEKDHEFHGNISKKKDLKIVLTKQEHSGDSATSALEYILASVPHYFGYEKVLQDFENGILTDSHQYSEAVDYFSNNGYYYIKDLILSTLEDFQISNEKAKSPFKLLSGGEKRFVELVRMMYSKADLLLIDEPTNHMDYVGKEEFIDWMKSVDEGILVVTHDRDVLKNVDRIVELKNQTTVSFKGNYDQYLEQNTVNTKNSVVAYRNQMKKLEEAKKRVEWGLQMRAKSKAWKIRYDHWVRDYEKIKSETVKPSFWIDQESAEDLDKVVLDSYEKFKEKNIKIITSSNEKRKSELLQVKNLSLGYTKPLFSDISFKVAQGERVFIKGRNGAGKSTIVRTVMSMYSGKEPKAKVFDGEIKLGGNLRIGEYEQEIDEKYLNSKLEDAIYHVYESFKISIESSRIKGILSQYLFDPVIDADIQIKNLSGGQKARFQLIKMFANNPNLLILDEPTNHLDLPSIEELENALLNFEGGILFISHDTSFINKLGGEIVLI
jgi:ATP-binding cassette subfamily F protein 3